MTKRLIIGVSIFLMYVVTAGAQGLGLREQFIANYVAGRFQEQVVLIKKNKDKVPSEVKALIKEAMSGNKTHKQRMFLLDVANAMASMHKHWNGDDKPLMEVETVIKMELRKEQERKARAERWKKYERLIGTFVMKEHILQMEEKGLTPVIYPHWLHRIWFKCKVCHDSIFTMRRGANDISHKRIVDGKQCGVCHNGRLAFGIDDGCERCHIAEKPGVERLYDLEAVDHERIKEIARKVGSEWIPENLPGGRLPLDRFGFINWKELERTGAYRPTGSLNTDSQEEEIRDNVILFESKNPVLNDVVFSHLTHSELIGCSTCHPAVFKDELGGNPIKMTDMATGRYCGYCHGKVSFTFADCLRCHVRSKDEVKDNVLIRKAVSER